ncbi:TPA: hypothetical protein NJ652_001220 [Vibrio parahaemolyticus]|nr:hypothetical protein [Vibrio parahaemolyticus]
MSNKKLHSSKIQDLDSPQIITNLTLSNELSLRDAALAIYMNDCGFQAEICLDHDRQEHNFSKPPWEEFEFDIIYLRLLTACCDGSLRIASAERILGDTVPENLITVTVDDLVNWILKNQYQGGLLVSSCLAKSCSFSELFQFHDDGTQPNNADNDISLKPAPGRALFYGELESEEPQSMAAAQRELKLARQEIGRLKSAQKKSNELFEETFPKESTQLKIIAQLYDLIINGTYDQPALYSTDGQLINVLTELHEHKTTSVSTKTMQTAFANAKKILIQTP